MYGLYILNLSRLRNLVMNADIVNKNDLTTPHYCSCSF